MAARIVVRSLTGGRIQTERALGLLHQIIDFTTINQAINEPTIISGLPTPILRGMEETEEYDYKVDSANLKAQILLIGNGGHKFITDPSDAVPYSVEKPHATTDTSLFRLMPFLLREVTSDLSIAERRRYALRRTIEVNGILYAAYFGRRLEYDQNTADMTITHIVNGEKTTSEWIPTMDNLRPQEHTNETDYRGSYGSVSTFVNVVWSAKDIQDLKDACRILYGNERKAIISELSVAYGVEKPIVRRYPHQKGSAMNPTKVPPNTLFDFVDVELMAQITTYVPLAYADQEYTLSLDIGTSEPIFGKPV